MLGEFLKRLNPRRYDLYRDEVYARNKENLAPYVVVGLGMTAFNVVSQLFIERQDSFPLMVALLVYFAVLAAACRLAGDRVRATTPVMYGIQVPVMLVAIYMGTVFDPDTPTITFLMFLLSLPLFLLDKYWRVLAYETALIVLYVALALLFDNPDVMLIDMVHVLSFYFASVAMAMFVLAVRFESVENRCKLRDRSEHDELTGLKNRFALRSDFGGYQRTPVCLLMCDIDLFKHFNDQYGHAVGDEVIRTFAHTIEDEFGAGACYRYGGDEMLVIAKNWEPAEFEAALRRCQARLAKETLGGRVEGGIGCSCGYCHGQARNGEELRAMLNVADEQLYAVKEAGRGGIRGCALTPEAVAAFSAKKEAADSSDDPRGTQGVALRNHEDRRG